MITGLNANYYYYYYAYYYAYKYVRWFSGGYSVRAGTVPGCPVWSFCASFRTRWTVSAPNWKTTWPRPRATASCSENTINAIRKTSQSTCNRQPSRAVWRSSSARVRSRFFNGPCRLSILNNPHRISRFPKANRLCWIVFPPSRPVRIGYRKIARVVGNIRTRRDLHHTTKTDFCVETGTQRSNTPDEQRFDSLACPVRINNNN